MESVRDLELHYNVDRSVAEAAQLLIEQGWTPYLWNEEQSVALLSPDGTYIVLKGLYRQQAGGPFNIPCPLCGYSRKITARCGQPCF